MEPTLRDPASEAALENDGFAVFPGLAAPDLDFLRSMHGQGPRGAAPAGVASGFEAGKEWNRRMAPGQAWRIGADECDADTRGHIHREMAPFWQRTAEAILVDHEVVFTSFLTKFPGDESVLPLHQDPTFVDERRHRAVTVWIAIDDITGDRGNGPLHLLMGSHRVGLELRGTGTEPTYIDDQHLLWPHAVPVDARAGDVLVMDARLLHGSPPNRSEHARAAVAGVMAPRGAELCHAVGVGDETVDILRVDGRFYWETSPRSLREQIPEGYDVVATIPRTSDPTTTQALLRQQRRRRSWIARLRRS